MKHWFKKIRLNPSLTTQRIVRWMNPEPDACEHKRILYFLSASLLK